MSGALFLAVEPDEEMKSLLAQLLARIWPGPLPGKPSPPDNWHITVRFLGSLDDVSLDRLLAELDQRLAAGDGPNRSARVTVTLTGLGSFPGPDRATVLWVGVESPALFELAATVEDLVTSIGLEPEERPFRPHLTLSRIRPPEDVTDLVTLDWGRLRFPVHHLTLFRSERVVGGVRYRAIDQFDLEGGSQAG